MSTCLYRNQDNRIIFKLFFLLKKLFAFTIKYSTRSNEIYGSQLLFRYGNAATLKWNMQTKNQKTAKNVKKVKNIYILPCFHWGFDYEVILHWNPENLQVCAVGQRRREEPGSRPPICLFISVERPRGEGWDRESSPQVFPFLRSAHGITALVLGRIGIDMGN